MLAKEAEAIVERYAWQIDNGWYGDEQKKLEDEVRNWLTKRNLARHEALQQMKGVIAP